jgi:hypothetical protein
VQAVNYRHNGGATEVDFAGTALSPSPDGKAKVRSKRGTLEVQATFGNLQTPKIFGTEYLTYVLWAISPEGRAVDGAMNQTLSENRAGAVRDYLVQ